MAFPFIKLSNSNGPVVTGISHTKTKSLPGILAGVQCRGWHNSILSSPWASLDLGATTRWRKTLLRPIHPPHPSQVTRSGPCNQYDDIVTDVLFVVLWLKLSERTQNQVFPITFRLGVVYRRVRNLSAMLLHQCTVGKGVFKHKHKVKVAERVVT